MKVVRAKEVTRPTGVVSMYYGGPGSGKTYNAMHYPGPLFIVDTDNRSMIVYDQVLRQHQDKMEVFMTSPKTWEDFHEAVDLFMSNVGEMGKSPQWVIDNQEVSKSYFKPTIIIDSASSLIQLAQEFYMRKEKVVSLVEAFQWTDVNRIIDERIFALRDTAANIVLTAQVKDEFIEEKRTGDKVIDCYKRLPYWCDVVIRCESNGKEFRNTVEKNGLGITKNIQLTSVGIRGIEEITGK